MFRKTNKRNSNNNNLLDNVKYKILPRNMDLFEFDFRLKMVGAPAQIKFKKRIYKQHKEIYSNSMTHVTGIPSFVILRLVYLL